MTNSPTATEKRTADDPREGDAIASPYFFRDRLVSKYDEAKKVVYYLVPGPAGYVEQTKKFSEWRKWMREIGGKIREPKR